MKISVVVPLYNKADYIVRAVDSILEQSSQVAEIIVVDDGSTDDGVARLLQSHEKKIKLVQQANKGVSAARNAGVAVATSDYVAFLDADDYWYKCFVSEIESLHYQFPDAKLFFTAYQFYKNHRLVDVKNSHLPNEPAFVPDYFISCTNADLPITASSVCLNREILQSFGGFPENISMGEDQVVWAQFACLTPIAFSPKKCAVYDLDASLDDDKSLQKLNVSPHIYVFEKLIADGVVPIRLVKSVRFLIHLSVLSCVKNNLLAGKRKHAIKVMLKSNGICWDIYSVLLFIGLLIPRGFARIIYEFYRRVR